MNLNRVMMVLAVISLVLSPILFLAQDDEVKSGLEALNLIHVGKDLKVRSIQLAVDLAEQGSTIIVHQGDYYESISISKGVRVIGAPGEKCRLISNEVTRSRGIESMMRIVSDESPVEVSGLEFNVMNDTWDDAAIKVQWGSGHSIHDNKIYGGRQGIWVHGGDAKEDLNVDDITIYNNLISNVSGHGIYMQRTYGKVYNNRITNSTGDGIMIAFNWTYPGKFGGYIKDNVVENCSVGVNFVASSLFHYFSNRVSNCSVGELFNSSDQQSHDNSFFECPVGSRIMNGSKPLLRSNNYEDCTVPIEIDRCSGARIYENDMNGTYFGIQPVWEGIEQLDHDIAKNNTLDENPVYYSFGEKDADRTLNGYGQVFIAKSSDSKYSITDLSPSIVTVVSSEGVDLSGSMIPTGLKVIGSEVTGEGLEFPGGSAAWRLNAQGSSLSFYNSSLTSAGPHVMVLEDSVLNLYNGTFYGNITFKDSASLVKESSYIGLEVLYEDGKDHVMGAEFEIEMDGTSFRSTPLFGGDHDLTGKDGRAGPFWLPYTSIKMSGTDRHTAQISVNVTVDRSWEEEREIDLSMDHIERFTTSDIRAPSVPRNLRTVVVDDGIGIEWDENTDDTVLYRVYREEGAVWNLSAEVTMTGHTDALVENGTKARYRVTAVDDVGLESRPSVDVEGTSVDNVSPLPPLSLKIENIMDHSVQISWKRSPSPDVTLYEVYVVDRPAGQSVLPKRFVGSTAYTAFDEAGLSDKETLLSVRAVDEAGHRSLFCDPVDLKSVDLTWPMISNVKWTYGSRRASISFKTDVPTMGDINFGTGTTDLRSRGLDTLGTDHHFEMLDLVPKTTYYFYLFAVEPSGNSVTDDNKGGLYSFTTYASESFLVVTLLDEDSEPVSGAEVTADGPSGTVQVIWTEGGTYRAFIIPGNWTVNVVSSDHLLVQSILFEVGPGEWMNLTFDLVSIGWEETVLIVTVLDQKGVPIESASVEVNEKVVRSGPDGKVDFGSLATNMTYTIKVRAKGYKDLDKDITLGTKRKVNTLTVQMIEAEKEEEEGGLWSFFAICVVVLVLLIILVLIVGIVALKKRSQGSFEDAKVASEDAMEEDSEVRTSPLENGEKDGNLGRFSKGKEEVKVGKEE